MNSTYINPVIAGLNVRSVLIDVFKEAQHAGHVLLGYNPTQATKQPRNRIKRERLSLEEWQTIFSQAENYCQQRLKSDPLTITI